MSTFYIYIYVCVCVCVCVYPSLLYGAWSTNRILKVML